MFEFMFVRNENSNVRNILFEYLFFNANNDSIIAAKINDNNLVGISKPAHT